MIYPMVSSNDLEWPLT